MQYPLMRGGGTYKVATARLDGGVNLSDPPGQVEDNQLTACHNMWWHKGALRTRPGLTSDLPGQFVIIPQRQRISEQEEVLIDFAENRPNLQTLTAHSVHATDGIAGLGYFTFPGSGNYIGTARTLVVKSGASYLIYTEDGKIHQSQRGACDKMQEIKPYVPLVTVEKFNADTATYQQLVYEPYNLLTDDIRCSYTTDGERDTFPLPSNVSRKPLTVTVQLYNLREKTVRTLTVEVTDGYGEVSGIDMAELEPLDGDPSTPFGSGSTVIECTVNYSLNTVTVRARTTDELMLDHYTELPAVTSNNLEITLTVQNNTTVNRYEHICGGSNPTWFGGSNSGLCDGTRLFVSNNNFLRWSEVDNPLYFPENNYVCIGESGEGITALAKQSELLIVFTKSAIYAMQYVRGNDVTLEDLQNGADSSATAATFPVTPIHPTIGCDCPGSVRLVNNRLVWATSDAHIYMMPNINQYSERNVRDITALIRRQLEEHQGAALKQAMAGEYAGHYMLMLPSGDMFLLDVGNSAFQSYAYYASEKRASRMLPWYIWNIPDTEVAALVSNGERAQFLSRHNGSVYLTTFGGTTDYGVPIPCSFATKLYDFGQPDKLKRIGDVHITVGNEPGTEIRLSYITERGTVEDAYPIETLEENGIYDAGYFTLQRVSPNINRTRTFGLQCDSDGAMAVEGIRLTYSLQGDAR